MQAIHDKGGYRIVQEPKTAKFNWMPEASIHGCPVDAVLATEKICEELALIDKYTIQKMVSHNEQNQQTETDVGTILEILFKYKGVDFSNYKDKTINRLIERRMIHTDKVSLKSYLDYLQATPQEVAINLSVREFDSHEFFALLMQLCKENPSLAENVQFEITERLIMPEGEALKRKLEKIQGLGFKFIVDDFGTGYSNLKYLSSMSPEALKIDMCFVKEIGFEDDTSEEIIKATIAMAKALKLKVTAEGVETPEQFEFLKNKVV